MCNYRQVDTERDTTVGKGRRKAREERKRKAK